MLLYLRVGSRITFMQAHTQTMQQTHTHKSMVGRVKVKMLLSLILYLIGGYQKILYNLVSKGIFPLFLVHFNMYVTEEVNVCLCEAGDNIGLTVGSTIHLTTYKVMIPPPIFLLKKMYDHQYIGGSADYCISATVTALAQILIFLPTEVGRSFCR